MLEHKDLEKRINVKEMFYNYMYDEKSWQQEVNLKSLKYNILICCLTVFKKSHFVKAFISAFVFLDMSNF